MKFGCSFFMPWWERNLLRGYESDYDPPNCLEKYNSLILQINY